MLTAGALAAAAAVSGGVGLTTPSSSAAASGGPVRSTAALVPGSAESTSRDLAARGDRVSRAAQRTGLATATRTASANKDASAAGAAAAGVLANRKLAAAAKAAAVKKAAAEKAARQKAAALRKAAADRKAKAARTGRSRQRAQLASRNPRTVARSMVAARGWGSGQFSCLNSLWNKESNWKVSADNPTSSAYGIPQALPGSKMASAGRDWRTNPATQIEWGLEYIADRYGTPCAAWGHSQRNNWY